MSNETWSDRVRPSLERGLILDGAAHCRLADAAILAVESGSGDRVVAATHAGYGYKSSNEDRIALVETIDADRRTAYCFVIDGMGGHRGGDVAAQLLAEELIRVARLTAEELENEQRGLMVERVMTIVERLPHPRLIRSILHGIDSLLEEGEVEQEPEGLHQAILEVVQLESIHVPDPSPESLARIAEVVQMLTRLTVPSRTEVAAHSTRRRMGAVARWDRPPDACFIGAVVSTELDGARSMSVEQVGDCRLFVCDPRGRIKFRSINESYIAEPNLSNPDIALADLMTYSLHRNLVTNSINRVPLRPKQYRRDDIPLQLEPGDLVHVYSDGCDDIFSPEEIVGLIGTEPDVEALRHLLEWSERRMRHVSALIEREREARAPEEQHTVYPAVHQRMNEARVRNGCYLERYPDGTNGRWLKPPKCDNIAYCVMRMS